MALAGTEARPQRYSADPSHGEDRLPPHPRGSAPFRKQMEVGNQKLESRYRSIAKWTLGFTLAVILWGALVRIEGAGAGCGNNWPLCNGEMIPHAAAAKTLIEFTHRMTVTASTIGVIAQVVLAFLAFRRSHPARLLSVLALVFFISEAAIGAGLVLFDHVAGDTSIARGYWVAGHLCNTFLLVGFLLLATLAGEKRASEPGGAPGSGWCDVAPRGQLASALGALVLGVMIVGALGAVAALSDTLFPAKSLAEGLEADFAPSRHAFLAIRSFHPAAAVVVALGGLALAGACSRSGFPNVRRWATRLGGLIALQVIAGGINVILLAPAPLQLFHLLLADAVWICAVALGWALYASRAVSAAHASDEVSIAPAHAPPAISR